MFATPPHTLKGMPCWSNPDI